MPQYLCKTDLSRRKYWNARRIDLFLGEPDKHAPNPKGFVRRPMRLYSLDRIQQVEHSTEFFMDVWKSKQRGKPIIEPD